MNQSDKIFNDEKFAKLYIKKHSNLLERVGKKYARKLKKLNFNKGNILDVGCGFGQMGLTIIEELPQCKLTGIDLSMPLLEHAKNLSAGYNLNDRANFIRGNVSQLPFNDNEFDVVFNLNMVHLVDEPVLMLNEIRRVLKPDGLLFIKDLKHSCLCLFEKEIRFAFSLNKAKELITFTYLKGGRFKKSLLWWEYNIT